MKSLLKFYFLFLTILFANLIFINCEDKKSDDEVEADGFTKEDRELLKKNEEKFNFNVEVTRMMDIIINSLYTNKEVFIRELISNASDACDKARFLAVQNPDYFGENKELKIVIETDRNSKTFSITDTGVGMTKNDLVKNLGTIAKSGTTSFIEAISKGNSLNLIGQFGVGFYSTYLVSNKVVVTSKNADDSQHVWVSTAGSSFTVSKDPRGDTLGRGTKITLYLKEDSVEFCETETVKKNIKKYSEFIDYPIYMKINKTYTEEEEIDEPENETDTTAAEEAKSEEGKNKSEELEVKDEDEDKKKEKKKKTKSITKWKWDYELINENKPIWLRDKKEITKEEYVKLDKNEVKEEKSTDINEINLKANVNDVNDYRPFKMSDEKSQVSPIPSTQQENNIHKEKNYRHNHSKTWCSLKDKTDNSSETKNNIITDVIGSDINNINNINNRRNMNKNYNDIYKAKKKTNIIKTSTSFSIDERKSYSKDSLSSNDTIDVLFSVFGDFDIRIRCQKSWTVERLLNKFKIKSTQNRTYDNKWDYSYQFNAKTLERMPKKKLHEVGILDHSKISVLCLYDNKNINKRYIKQKAKDKVKSE